jgi:hypothetical protein
MAILPGEQFPYLSDLLGGYFHQDCYDFDDTDDDIIREFRKSSWDYQQLGVRADIRRLLHQHGDRLLDTIQTLFAPSIIIGTPQVVRRVGCNPTEGKDSVGLHLILRRRRTG